MKKSCILLSLYSFLWPVHFIPFLLVLYPLTKSQLQFVISALKSLLRVTSSVFWVFFCFAPNKRTFLNDELLLCKWHLTATVSAWRSPRVRQKLAWVRGRDTDHFHDCRELKEGRKIREKWPQVTLDKQVCLLCSKWPLYMKNIASFLFPRHERVTFECGWDKNLLKVKKLLLAGFIEIPCKHWPVLRWPNGSERSWWFLTVQMKHLILQTLEGSLELGCWLAIMNLYCE